MGCPVLKRFKVPKREALLSADMPAVEAWYRQQKAIQTTRLQNKSSRSMARVADQSDQSGDEQHGKN